MDREICFPGEDGQLDFLREDPLAPDFAQWCSGEPVSGRLDNHHLDLKVTMGTSQAGRNKVSLGKGEWRTPRGKSNSGR
jgi:hypothetical protein